MGGELVEPPLGRAGGGRRPRRGVSGDRGGVDELRVSYVPELELAASAIFH